MKFQFIDDYRSEFSVVKMCTVLHVSTSGYFKWRKHKPSQQEIRREEMKKRIVYHYNDSDSIYGSPKVTKLLVKEGYDVTERTVSVYMKELGLRSCVSKKYKVCTTNSNHDCPIAPNR